jgi:hypothetical protein
MTGRSHTHGLRREAIGWQSRTAAARCMDALSCIVVIALMVPARTHLRAVAIAPRRHIRSVLWRPLVAVAYWSWHVISLGNAAHERLASMRYLERGGRVMAAGARSLGGLPGRNEDVLALRLICSVA